MVVTVPRGRSSARRGGISLAPGNSIGVGSLGRPSVQVALVLIHSPVEDVVVLEALADEEITEDLAKVAVVGLVVESKRTGVVEVDGKLVREATAENLGGGGHLLLHDPVILLLLGGSLKTLPGEGATAEVEHDVAERFHIVAARLLCHDRVSGGWGGYGEDDAHTNSKMRVDGSIPSRAGQVLVLSVRDVEMGLRVAVFLGQTKVNDVDLVASLADAHEEVVGLDIAVDERLGMDVLDSGDELVGQEEHRLQRELAVAEVEEVLEAGPEEIQDHRIVVTFRAKPADKGDANSTGEGLVDAGFVLELGMLGLDALELDGDLLARDDVGSQVDVAKRAGPDLPADPVLVTDAEVLVVTG